MQMFDRYKTERKMAKKFKEDEFHINRHEYDITAFDTTVRENRSEHSKMKKFVLGLRRIPAHLRFREESPIYTASASRSDDPYVMVRDAAMATREDDDDDITAPRDPQPSKPRGSPRDSQIMPPKGMSTAAIQKLVTNKVAEALAADRTARNDPNVAGVSGVNGDQGGAPPVRNVHLLALMKCSYPVPWSKGKFAAATLQGRALTWWNSQVATLGLDVVNGKSWTDMMKKMMEELCPDEEVQRLENKLRSLRLRDTNIVAYTQRFNELALLCPEAVPTEKKKVELYIKGLLENIKGETTSSRPAVLNEAVRMAHTLMEQKIQDKAKRVAENNKRKWESNNNQGGNNNNNRNNYRDNTRQHQYNNIRQGNGANRRPIVTVYELGRKDTQNRCPKRNDLQGGNATGRAYAIREAKKGQGPNVVAVKLNTSYEVELADGRIVSTNTVLRGCTLKLINYLFEIDLMPIELGTFDIVIGMDWLVEHDAVIVCGKKEVHIPSKERGVSSKEPSKRRLEDVPVVCEFPEVFPDDLLGLPPPRQVEFRIELVP
ncbi:putative reverse transcriptase domain-containing protein [Tanacetum coccineum]